MIPSKKIDVYKRQPSTTVQPPDYQTLARDAHHDSDAAAQKNEIALTQLDKGDLDAAAQTARQALSADVTLSLIHIW